MKKKTCNKKFVLTNVSWIIVSLNFCILSLFFVSYPQALYANSGCLKGISGIKLSANKNLFNISFSVYLLLSCSYV